MRGVVEQQSFADCLTGTETHETHRARVVMLLYRDGPADDDREELARRSFLEQELVGLEGLSRDELRQLMQRRFRGALQKSGLAQFVAVRGGRSHEGEKLRRLAAG